MLLDDRMTELADAIRRKTGKTGKLSISKMVSALSTSEKVYWDGNISNNSMVHSLPKPIPAHTKISDIIITSDKPDKSFLAFLLVFKDQDKANVKISDLYYEDGRWTINIIDDKYISLTELPDDLVGIEAISTTVNNLKIVVKGSDSGIPTYTTVFQAYTGLANAIKKSTSTSGKLTIEKMITLLGGTT